MDAIIGSEKESTIDVRESVGQPGLRRTRPNVFNHHRPAGGAVRFPEFKAGRLGACFKEQVGSNLDWLQREGPRTLCVNVLDHLDIKRQGEPRFEGFDDQTP